MNIGIQKALTDLLLKEKELSWYDEVTQNTMVYNKAIGESAQANAIAAQIQARLASEKLPYELDEIKIKNMLSKIEMQELLKALSGQSENEISDATNIPGEEKKGETPDDYLISSGNRYERDILRKYEEGRLSPTQLAGKKSSEESFSRYGAELYHDTMKELNTSSTIASKEISTINDMMNIWDRLPIGQKETYFAELPAIDPRAKLFDALRNGLVLNQMLQQTGVVSDPDREYIEKTYGNRSFDNESFNELMTLRKLMDMREIEKQRFFSKNSIKVKDGIIDTGDLESAWVGWSLDHSIRDTPEFKFMLERRKESMSPSSRARERIRELQEKRNK